MLPRNDIGMVDKIAAEIRKDSRKIGAGELAELIVAEVENVRDKQWGQWILERTVNYNGEKVAAIDTDFEALKTMAGQK